jgi:hypothetical protein
MKKIITLMLAFGIFIAVHAQTSKEEARRVILGQPKSSPQSAPSSTNSRDVILGGGGNNGNNYPGTYPNSSRQARIDQVNREYDSKIQSIRSNPYLSQAEKDREIRQLEEDRANRIRQINADYGTRNKNYKKYKKKYDDDDDDRYEKQDNGKHLGWEKGKGNPHKNGGKNKH